MFMAYTFPLAERSGVNLKGVSAPSTVTVEEEGAAQSPRLLSSHNTTTLSFPAMFRREEPMRSTLQRLPSLRPPRAAPASSTSASTGLLGACNQAFADPASSVAKHAWPCLVERLQTVLQVFDASVPSSCATCVTPSHRRAIYRFSDPSRVTTTRSTRSLELAAPLT